MRVIGGLWRGRTLQTPADQAIRPTSDKARQAIFNTLLSGRFDLDLDNAVVMDGTAGTGAMGIEALSRGAAHVHFVDPSHNAMMLVHKNLTALKAEKETFSLHKNSAQNMPANLGTPCDLVFLDPPYKSGILNSMIGHLKASGWTHSETVFVIEEDAMTPILVDAEIIERKIYGAAQIVYCK